jgi:tetratricopeptide (TPR) repeat protein
MTTQMNRLIKKISYLICFLVAFALGLKQLREPDIWWQLLSGRWMLEHGQITKTDVFSYTMAGRPWVNVKWLYEILIGSFEKAMGPEVVLLLQALVNVIIVLLLIKTINFFKCTLKENASEFFTVIAALLFLAIVEYRMAGRPEMISHLMCALYLFILWRSPQMEWKGIFWLVPLQCLWANMHEGYPVGIVIIGTAVAGSFLAFLLTKEKKYFQQTFRIFIIGIGALIIILCNPNGIQLWKQPFEIYRQVWANKYTTELFSYRDVEYWTLEAKTHIVLLVAVCLFWLLRLLQIRKQKESNALITPMSITYLLLIPLFGYLSLTANRNIPFTQIVLFPSIPVMLSWLVKKSGLQKLGLYRTLAARALIISSLIGIAFYITVVNNSFYKFTKSPNRYGIHVAMLHNPTGAATFIKEHKLTGVPFSDYFVSSYLLWDLFPSFKSYIDLRDLDVFPVKFFDEYFSMYNNPEKFTELDKKYNFNYVVLSTSQLQSLQMKLYYGENFNLVYIDPVSCVYLKVNAINRALNNASFTQKLFSWPPSIEDPSWAGVLTRLLNPLSNYDDEEETNAPVYAARFYNSIKAYPTAIKLLAPAMANFENNADAYAALGNSYLLYAMVLNDPNAKRQKLDSARTLLDQAESLDKKNEEVYSSLANLSIISGNYEEAKGYLDKYIDLNGHNDYIYFLSGICSRYLWKKGGGIENRQDVIKRMKQSARLNPQNGKAYLYLSEAYMADGDKDAARENLKRAVASKNSLLPDEQTLLDQLKQGLAIQ